MKETPTYPKAILGIDVSKKKLDVCFIPDETVVKSKRGQRSLSQPKSYSRSVPNTEAGIAKLAEWITSKGCTSSVHVCLEPTSTYHELAAEVLSLSGHHVSVSNAGHIRNFALAMGIDTKTDGIDAQVIAEFCRARRPLASTPMTEADRQLRELTRRRSALVKLEQKERNRIETTRLKSCRDSIRIILTAVEKERLKIEQLIEQLIEQNDELRTRDQLYRSIKGVGRVVSSTVMAELRDLEHFESARQAVAYIGLAPRRKQSGSSLNRFGGITKRGNSRLREVLFMSASVAMRNDPVLRAFAQRLREASKKKKVVIVAVMRKIVHLLYGIAKSGQPRRLPSPI